MSSFSEKGNLHMSHRTSQNMGKGSILGIHDSVALALTEREIKQNIKELRLSIASAKRFGKPFDRMESQLKEEEYRLRELGK